MKKPAKSTTDDLRPEYDMTELLEGGEVGKHANHYQASSNLVLIDPEIRGQFRSSKDLNDAPPPRHRVTQNRWQPPLT